MNFSSLYSKDCTKAAVLLQSKKRILEYISQLAHTQLPQITEQEILDSLLSREKLGSTGIGNGIAIPHGRLKGTHESVAIVLVCQSAVPFDAIDNKPVDIFIALLVPDKKTSEHLKMLAHIAEKLSDKSFCKLLRHAENDEALYQIISVD